ncbi:MULTISPECIES: complex I NDUFA9 subunit family protein [unclassified Roseateles]|uniref:complex I NDUFA9 subunit family protein n=1 Tax=unclassified Roseateles TaxID=2626991 RepID=UPI0006FC795D|nr:MULTISPECIES: complex I NDUFA9 subunit family protein [unclassified Roseateles]KQW51270.1 NAD-dependent dehydratase [Pelomonas sp. Root405]KRA77502.1 NAD-dependent dehydratase [Pelomonas sp. Root662]
MSFSVLVLGGSGFVGRALCEQLMRRLGAGVRITVPTRRLAHARDLQSLPGVTVLQADVFRDLATLLSGHHAVVNLVAILQGNAAAFEHVHVELPRRIAAAMGAAGPRRLVHVSALGVAEHAPSRYLRSKAAGEAVLQVATQTGALELSLLRPSLVFGDGDKSVNLFARLQGLFPLMPLAGSGARLQPVWVQDLARAIVEVLMRRDTIGQTFEIAGPRELTLAELVRLAGRTAGHERTVLALPGPLATLQALAMECLPGEPLLSRDNLASLSVPNVPSGQLPGLAELGITPASLEAVLPTYLAPGAGVARLNAWRARR